MQDMCAGPSSPSHNNHSLHKLTSPSPTAHAAAPPEPHLLSADPRPQNREMPQARILSRKKKSLKMSPHVPGASYDEPPASKHLLQPLKHPLSHRHGDGTTTHLSLAVSIPETHARGSSCCLGQRKHATDACALPFLDHHCHYCHHHCRFYF